MMEKLKLIFSDPNLRRRIFFVLGAMVVFRIGANIAIPGVDQAALSRLFSGEAGQFLSFLNIFAGGGMSNLSIMMLGVGPYITATIILQLLTMIFPSLKELYHGEGEAGRRKFNQYSRLLTVPLAIFQGFGLLALLSRAGVLIDLSVMDRIVNISIVVAGTMLLTWIGELISEYGIGNGVSLLIFAGIVSRVPSSIAQLYTTFTPDQLPVYLAFAVAAVAVIIGIVLVTEAERPIPMTYAKQVRGNKMYGGASTYLPIRLNNAGVMPIIFALSILMFPQMIVNFFGPSATGVLASLIDILRFLVTNPWMHGILYFVFVFLFTYFYSAVTFDPEAIATNLQKSGAFIPGVRPGRPTAEYLGKTLYRLTLIGACFLGLVAVLPMVFQGWTGISTLAIGGTSILIVVSVAIDFLKQLEAQASMREY